MRGPCSARSLPERAERLGASEADRWSPRARPSRTGGSAGSSRCRRTRASSRTPGRRPRSTTSTSRSTRRREPLSRSTRGATSTRPSSCARRTPGGSTWPGTWSTARDSSRSAPRWCPGIAGTSSPGRSARGAGSRGGRVRPARGPGWTRPCAPTGSSWAAPGRSSGVSPSRSMRACPPRSHCRSSPTSASTSWCSPTAGPPSSTSKPRTATVGSSPAPGAGRRAPPRSPSAHPWRWRGRCRSGPTSGWVSRPSSSAAPPPMSPTTSPYARISSGSRRPAPSRWRAGTAKPCWPRAATTRRRATCPGRSRSAGGRPSRST